MREGNGMFWEEYFVYDVTAALVAGTGVSFTEIPIKILTDSNFKLIKLTFTATSDKIKLKMRDSASGRYLFKDAIDIKSIAGRNTLAMGCSNSFIPFILPKPFVLPAGGILTVEASDFSAATNTMRLALHGTKIHQGRAPWDRRWSAITPAIYGFTGGVVTVGASSTATGKAEIDIDSHFLVQKITGIRSGEATVLLKENGRDREWSSTAIHVDNLLGNGAFPNILPNGGDRFLPRGSVLTANLTDLSGISNPIEVNLVGVKLYE